MSQYFSQKKKKGFGKMYDNDCHFQLYKTGKGCEKFTKSLLEVYKCVNLRNGIMHVYNQYAIMHIIKS